MRRLDLPIERTLMFAPHPDDESIGAGGLLAHIAHAGGKVCVMFMTNGDNNPWPQRAYRRRWSISSRDRKAWGRLRRCEARQALRILGLPTGCAKFLDFPDDGLAQIMRKDRDRLIVPLAKIIADMQPTLILVPSIEDLHADHRATYRAALRALFPPEMPKPQLALAYVVHGRSKSHEQVEFELCATDLERKRRAIDCHQTQLLLSRRRFLEYASRKEEFVPVKIVTVRDESRAARWRAKCRHVISVLR